MRLAKRRVRQLAGRELRHFVQVHRPMARYGDWTVAPSGLKRGGIAYSLGVGEDATFDTALIEHFGMEVHAFDPTPRAIAWVSRQNLPPGFHFHPTGVGGHDGTADFAPSGNSGNPSYRMRENAALASAPVTCPVRKLSTLTRMLGHPQVELLKIDIEGAEYDVIDDLLDSDIEVHQLLVEFHHRFGNIGRGRTARAVSCLQEAGYRIFFISPSGREYSFIHFNQSRADGQAHQRRTPAVSRVT